MPKTRVLVDRTLRPQVQRSWEAGADEILQRGNGVPKANCRPLGTCRNRVSCVSRGRGPAPWQIFHQPGKIATACNDLGTLWAAASAQASFRSADLHLAQNLGNSIA